MAVAEASALAEPRPRPARREPGLLVTIARRWADYLYVLPALLVMLVVIGYPLVSTVFLSFHEITPRNERVYTGVDNYQEILTVPKQRFCHITCNACYLKTGSR